MADGISTDQLRAWLVAFAGLVEGEKEHLTELDAAIGDADHGSNMARGLAAVVTALDGPGLDSGPALLKKAGMTMVSTVGGASGPLYGTFFLRFGSALGDAEPVPPATVAAAWRAGLDGVVSRGKASVGDKTMLDALTPAVQALEAAVADGRPWAEALTDASAAAAAGRDATTPMTARKGRASYLGERSAGHPDPGATSVALLVAAAVDTLASA